MPTAERPTMKRAALPPCLPAALLLLAVMLLPGAARAQWTQDANSNITTGRGCRDALDESGL
ncbi:MAG: hypothetical protein M3348_00660 [Acidobacteriota bacterium]|nr:hypothetical protein [Acidobacteriota bacterium]